MKKIFSLAVLTTIFSLAALADVRLPDTPKPTPSPKPKKAVETTLRIGLDRNAKEARLLIPRDQLKQLRAELDELDGGPNNTALLGFSRTQTVLSGLFLSLGLVFGGVWFARSRRNAFKPGKPAIAGAVLFFGGALATMVFANVGPPLEARSLTGKIFSPAVHQYKQASGKIRIEATDDNYPQLIVPDAPADQKTGEE